MRFVAIVATAMLLLVGSAVHAKTISVSVKGTTGSLYFDPPGPHGLEDGDVIRVTNSTDPPVPVTVYTKSEDGVTYESYSINPGHVQDYDYVGDGVTAKQCVTETKGDEEVCIDLLYVDKAPSLGQFGLIGLGVLLLVSGIIWRRRTTMAQRGA